jgi:hypothetical protein
MSAKKRQAEDGGTAVANGAGGARSRRLFVFGAVVVLLLGGSSYLVWQEVGPHVLAGSQYQLETDQIHVAPAPPAWVHSDVKAEALRHAQLDGPLSLIDRELTVKLAAAFSAHPWVARVERVSKHYPAGVDVALVYRKPAAMVEVQDGAGGLPVDGDGILLPTKDFSVDDAQTYPRISEIHSTPTGSIGASWGDPCVTGAAQVAAAIAADWQALGLFRIVPDERRPARSGVEYTFALVTNSGTKIHWGRPPGPSLRGEVAAGEKIAQLKRYAAQNRGSLDDPEGQPHEITISSGGALLSTPRPRIEPLPKND